MAFPTTSILDSFTRADQGPPPSTDWTIGPVTFGAGEELEVISNTCAANTALSNDYWNLATFGPDSEVFCTLSTLSTTNNDPVFLLVRCVNIGAATSDGYFLQVERNGGVDNLWSIGRMDDTNPVTLGATFTQAYAAGDSIGLEIVGSTLTAYHKPSAGSWTALTTRTDSTYSAAGRIAAAIQGTVWRIDNFGGGTVVVGAEPLPRHLGRGAGW